MNNLKYNYVVFGTDSDLARFTFSDLVDKEGVYLAPTIEENLGGIYPIYRFHLSDKVNSIVKLPLKSIWNPYYFKNPFEDDKPICFVFMRYVSFVNKTINLTDYFRKKYQGSKCVLYIRDLFERQINKYYNTPFDIEDIRKQYDLTITFDEGDRNKYKLAYFPLVMSSFHEPVKNMPESDVFFVGWAKNRLKEIIGAYEVLRSHGLRLDFNLAGVEEDQKVYKDDIHYISYMDYGENLQHVVHTKCLLEIMQKGQASFTQRGAEAVCLGKKLLTNNSIIEKEPFYNPEYISRFDNPRDMDEAFIAKISEDINVDYHYKEHFSPLALLAAIDKQL